MSAQNKENFYLLKKLLSNKPENDYENLVSYYLNSFWLDWDLELNKSKSSLCKYFNLSKQSYTRDLLVFDFLTVFSKICSRCISTTRKTSSIIR